MSIKLNGVEITSNKLNSSNVTLEKLDGVKVWPTAVPATGWSALSGTYYDYVASFEKTAHLINPTVNGCGYMKTDLPSASLYLVGDIVRGRINTTLGGLCDTWAYFEAV